MEKLDEFIPYLPNIDDQLDEETGWDNNIEVVDEDEDPFYRSLEDY